ncbi:MAG: hypothetical protein FJZ90_01725 [Chloroflexi bacterium]|nr:hypothetical protein [Chloroflexota bacterium]
MAEERRGAQLPIQPVERPILYSPYDEPDRYWLYGEDHEPRVVPGRRPAGYYYRVRRSATQQLSYLAEEQREDLAGVNALREDIKRWRASGYEGATEVSKKLLRYWRREGRSPRLFFCQLEAAETIIFLNEIRLAGRRPRFSPKFDEAHLTSLLDHPADPGQPPLRRLGIKMATGSGKTVVMAMLIAWSFCNRAQVRSDTRFPLACLAVCPNLTIKERLQVLRPGRPDNYYDAFDLVPHALRPLLNQGKVEITNWHLFAPESEHQEGGQSYAVVNKGPEGDDAFCRRVLGELYGEGEILVINDEAHHAWRAPVGAEPELAGEVQRSELEEATVWVNGLDTLNRGVGVRFCADLSATPFYIAGSGHVEGSPFPWLVSDFGLVDAIECGIVKIPRLPVSDTTGRPEPRYFNLWRNIVEEMDAKERRGGRGRSPKPEAVYREAQPALLTLAGQWVERFKQIEEASDEKDKTPPALIIVCDNTDVAEEFYKHISGERVVEEEEPGEGRGRRKVKRTVYGSGDVFPEYFSNSETRKPTIRIDSKLLAEAESGDPNASRSDAAEELRQIVATVGVKGQPGEQVRCVVSVAMLNEGWDAHNVTNILGLRAFESQLLCEQVVGRGLRRMDYAPDPETGLLTEEYVDIYGVPFSLIPFKGREVKAAAPEDKPLNHVRALPERAGMEIRFPRVEGYAFALKRNLIRADLEAMQPLRIEPEREPTAVFVKPRVGYELGQPTMSGPGEYQEQTREAYYASTHLQTICFEIARMVVDRLLSGVGRKAGGAGFTRQSRQQLFPQVFRLVQDYVERKVDFRGEDPCELGQQKYVDRVVGLLCDAIRPDETQGEPPLLPILNRYDPTWSTAKVDFKTVKPCHSTVHSHVNLVAADTARWEQRAAFRLEQAAGKGLLRFYARNEELGFEIPYEFMGIGHAYWPDYLVRLADGRTLALEIKGLETEEDRAKHEAARRWCDAVNTWGQLGEWCFHVTRDPQMLVKELEGVVGRG